MDSVGQMNGGNVLRTDDLAQIYCDFDGTVSVQDATDFVLSQLADPEWQEIERLWENGEIGSGECMRRQVSLIRARPGQLDEVLDEIEIDPFFASFANFCAARSLPVTIVSDGVDHFIRRILRRHGLDHLPVVANRLVVSTRTGQPQYFLSSPHAGPTCTTTAGVCKCRWLTAHKQERVYIGDGRSDFCVADKPEFLFAKGELARHCAEREIPFFAYRDFGDVIASLRKAAAHLPEAVEKSQYATV
ncbi:MtnX-like HAD-IB family phosphatase [Mesorhizobium sp. BAC0120]|uniref:MtnX-like HAD-IB family phosphatase n=1 Tax=Mesorhizobium sp. BAC0120 TaxID=3090670 RepID=UPI00298C367B|nr:MtnX-like HAD-IB family phosphatase [Mesorhizobium sp. BAC0120]MDW6025474.1 MtnX-like HAD-IB family phosphatase [Mesorhizobium sp. BAC0120]